MEATSTEHNCYLYQIYWHSLILEKKLNNFSHNEIIQALFHKYLRRK